jgi:hypothetical protein
VAALALLLVLVIAALSLSSDDETEVTEANDGVDAPPAEDQWEDDGLLGFDGDYVEGDSEGRPRSRMWGDEERWDERRRGRMGMRGFRRRLDGGAPDPEWEARRARRRERFLRRIEVIALGPEEPSTTNEEIFDAFRDVRPLVRDCLRDAGVDRGAWRQMRSTSRTLSFDLDAEGGVVPESSSFEPALPAPFDECMRSSLEVLTVEPPGDDGARVSIEFPERRRRRGDAGTR